MNEIRAFIAIDLPGNVVDQLAELGRALGANLDSHAVRWVRPEAIHLTLRFLGNVQIDKLDDISRGIDQVASQTSPFSLTLDKLGCFPNPRRPRVIWIGLAGDIEQLETLQNSVEVMLSPMGWELEKRGFHPHLTLGRVKDSRKVIEARLPWGEVLARGRIPVEEMHLIQSQLNPGGAVYTRLHGAHFRA